MQTNSTRPQQLSNKKDATLTCRELHAHQRWYHGYGWSTRLVMGKKPQLLHRRPHRPHTDPRRICVHPWLQTRCNKRKPTQGRVSTLSVCIRPLVPNKNTATPHQMRMVRRTTIHTVRTSERTGTIPHKYMQTTKQRTTRKEQNKYFWSHWHIKNTVKNKPTMNQRPCFLQIGNDSRKGRRRWLWEIKGNEYRETAQVTNIGNLPRRTESQRAGF